MPWRLFDESELLFQPGESFSYSSLGTVLLSVLMQQQTNLSYQDFMQQAVFSPLQMNATLHDGSDLSQENLASFYWQNADKPTELKEWYQVDLSHRLAGGGWISTSKDLVKLLVRALWMRVSFRKR